MIAITAPRTNGATVPQPTYCAHAPDLEEKPARFGPEWHRQQEAEERAWLDHWARAQHLVLVTAA